MSPSRARRYFRVEIQHVIVGILACLLINLASSPKGYAAPRREQNGNSANLVSLTGHIYLSAFLPAGIVGTPYGATLSTRGGTPPFSFSLSGALPSGLSLNTVTGTISGTPATAGTFYFTVFVDDGLGDRGDKHLSITVRPAPTSSTPISVQISPTSSSLNSGGTQQFSATVSGTSSTGVSWLTTAGTISSSGLFTAPTVSTTSTVTVTARSVVSGDSRASALVTVTPSNQPTPVPTPTPTPIPTVAVTVSPTTSVVQTGTTIHFSASVSGSSNTSVTWTAGLGTISASGSYTAPSSAGTDTVIATSQADPTKAASATVTVQSSAANNQGGGGGTTPTVNAGGNAYCTLSGTWSGATTDGPANLPVRCMYTALSGTPSPGVVRGPDSTTSAVQADLNAAACGDKILVTAGSSLSTISLPGKGCDNAHWITIESTGVSSANFPAEGARMTPCWSGVASLPNRPGYGCSNPQVLTFKIVTPGSSNAIIAAGADHYRIIGAEITRVPTGGVPIYNLVDLSSKGTQTNNIIFDRDWFHGINQDGHFPMTSQSADTSTTRAVYLGQSNHIAVIDSYMSDFYDTGTMSANGNTDAQCIGGGVGSIPNSGWGVYKFVNDHCEASGEGILLGGSAGPALTPTGCTIGVNCNLDVPTDIEVRQNYFFKPQSWNGNTTVPVTFGWPVVKNGFEMKIGARALFEGNVIENTWYSAQVGYCWSTAPKNQSSLGTSAHGMAPTALTNDFTYRYNYCYNTAYGIGLYQSMDAACSTCQAQGANRISIHDNVIGDDLNMGNLSSTSAGDALEVLAAADSTGRGLNQLNNVNISHNTFIRAIRALTIFGGATGQMSNWTMQNNIWPYGNYGFGDIGNSGWCDTPYAFTDNAYGILNACISNYTVDHNAVFNWNGGVLGAKWPSNGSGQGNFFFTGTSGPGFTNYGTGDSNFNPTNYVLATSSPLHNAASDGRDLGADIPTVLKAISGVRE
jgi:Putative Ig domain